MIGLAVKRMRLVIRLICLVGIVESLAIPNFSFPDFSLNKLQFQKLKLENELKSLFPPNKEEDNGIVAAFNSDDTEEVVVLPHDLLISSKLSQLGLGEMIEHSYETNLNFSNGITGKLDVPYDATNLFVLNTTNSLEKGPEMNITEHVVRKFPFYPPKVLNLINYYLVVPQNYLDKNTFELNLDCLNSKSILRVPVSKLPFFAHSITKHMPLMVFIFNDDPEYIDKSFESMIHIDNHLAENKKNTFLDELANDWVNEMGYGNLIYSSFCSTNPKDLENSYCLNIEPKSSTLHIFPAFPRSFSEEQNVNENITNEVNVSNKPEDEEEDEKDYEVPLVKENSKGEAFNVQKDLEETPFKAQIFQQITDKFSRVGEKIYDTAYDFAVDPKATLREADNSLDRKLGRLEDKFKEIPDNMEDKLQDFKDKSQEKFALNHSFDKDEDYKPDWSNFAQTIEQINSDRWEDDGDKIYDFDRYNNQGFEGYSKRKRNLGESIFSEPEFFIPLSEVKQVLLIPLDSPRKKNYSQVVYGIDKEKVEGKVDLVPHYNNHYRNSTIAANKIKREEKDCVEITWFNLFHYSIFGKPNFCIKEVRP